MTYVFEYPRSSTTVPVRSSQASIRSGQVEWPGWRPGYSWHGRARGGGAGCWGAARVLGRWMGARLLAGLLVAWCALPVGRRTAVGQAPGAANQYAAGHRHRAAGNVSATEHVGQPRGESLQVIVEVVSADLGPQRIATVVGATLHSVRSSAWACRT